MGFHDGWAFWGMHAFWWILVALVIVVLVSPFIRTADRRHRDTPLEILQRRYAAGEMSTDEYEKRRVTLERDGGG